MMLNKYAVAFGFVASLVVVPGMALASDNTISFQGEVADETCEVSVNGNNASPVVLLPTVSASQLNAAGQTAGQTTFDIGVSGCTGDADGMTVSTVFVGNQVTSAGNLGNTGTANNAQACQRSAYVAARAQRICTRSARCGGGVGARGGTAIRANYLCNHRSARRFCYP
ncbi:MAG: fimbrial protein [Symbiopectobacterium sp.]|uniref:fimbrial protein n=1 Tax=Symbiopectobacterium sp. TaxID=2952789 RepID=UPI0039EBEC2C